MVYHYLKYYITPLLAPIGMVGMFLGGFWMWLGFVELLIIMTIGDEFFSEDPSVPKYKYPWLIEVPLHLALPLIALMLVTFAWVCGSGDQDFLGISALLNQGINYDFIAAREANHWHDYMGAVIGVGFMVAGYGTNVGHELVHRVKDSLAVLEGRWLFTASLNPDFSIEHVYGHHTYVGTNKDPATARKGANVYSFFIKSLVMGHISAWKLELKRLQSKNYSPYFLRNRMLTGYLMCLTLITLFYFAAGWFGLFMFFIQATIAKFILEIVNYMEHYGLYRNPGEPVSPQHSWNTNKRMSGMVLFSLTRHSAHHETPKVKFWKLDPYINAPQMPYGYLTTLFICLIPPLWYRVIEVPLKEWELKYSS